jgi:choloylglycine hydrolase
MACSRVFWNDNTVKVVGRTFDWERTVEDALWVMPPGLERSGAIDDNPAAWTSKYGSVVMGAFDTGATEGINERGLAAHMLYLAGTKFEPRDQKRPGIGFWLWVQYYLDNYRSASWRHRSRSKSSPLLPTAISRGVPAQRGPNARCLQPPRRCFAGSRAGARLRFAARPRRAG